MKLQNPKASFDNYYSSDSPENYVDYLVKQKNYRLPFYAAKLLKEHLTILNSQKSYETIFFGSGYGLDAAALKYQGNRT